MARVQRGSARIKRASALLDVPEQHDVRVGFERLPRDSGSALTRSSTGNET
jgi:hypothetical protein